MSNALGTISTGVVIARALELVYTQRPILSALSLDLSDAAVDYNQAVNTRTYAVPTVNTFGTGATDRADTNVSVTLNTFKEVHHAFTPDEITGTKRNLIDESAEPIAVAIANHMVDAIAAKWIVANSFHTTTQASGFNYNTLTLARQTLNGRGAPTGRRFCAANATVYKNFLDDTTIVATQNNPGQRSIQDGVLSKVAGFDVYEYPSLPTTNNKVAFFSSPDSTIYVGRVPKDINSLTGGKIPFPGNSGVVTNPQTGLSVMVDEWITPTTRAVNVRVSWMYGIAVGNVNNGEILITS